MRKRLLLTTIMSVLTLTSVMAQGKSDTMYVVHRYTEIMNDSTTKEVAAIKKYPVARVDTVMYTTSPNVRYSSCPDDNHPHYIDLGLSKMWACCNVGATKPEEYGYAIKWGYTDVDDGYDFATYFHDPATAKWGGTWMSPTLEDFDELIANTTMEEVWVNGSKGLKIKSKKKGYTHAYIFLPYSGYSLFGEHKASNSYGYYWASNGKIYGDIGYGYAYSYKAQYGGLAQQALMSVKYSFYFRPVCIYTMSEQQ